jgi:hypothetical protein
VELVERGFDLLRVTRARGALCGSLKMRYTLERIITQRRVTMTKLIALASASAIALTFTSAHADKSKEFQTQQEVLINKARTKDKAYNKMDEYIKGRRFEEGQSGPEQTGTTDRK